MAIGLVMRVLQAVNDAQQSTVYIAHSAAFDPAEKLDQIEPVYSTTQLSTNVRNDLAQGGDIGDRGAADLGKGFGLGMKYLPTAVPATGGVVL